MSEPCKRTVTTPGTATDLKMFSCSPPLDQVLLSANLLLKMLNGSFCNQTEDGSSLNSFVTVTDVA